jgi:quercetin dioxygenase-like cupin family protein
LAKAGSKILDSEGYGLIFRQTAQDTNGKLLEMDAFYRPHGNLPPPHLHPAQEEHFEILSGTFRVHLANAVVDYKPGGSFHVPIGVTHAMHNISDKKGIYAGKLARLSIRKTSSIPFGRWNRRSQTGSEVSGSSCAWASSSMNTTKKSASPIRFKEWY